MTSNVRRAVLVVAIGAVAGVAGCRRAPEYRTFATPEDAVRALNSAAKSDEVGEVVAIFGPAGQSLIDSSDRATARRNRDVFLAAMAERWRLEPAAGGGRVLVVGNEDWPFPVPLVQDGGQWRFDTSAGAEEVLARRIGRNELAAIRACRTYVVAQRVYAARSRDGQPAGRFATKFQSDAGMHNGLYWPAGRGERRSPLGDLVTRAAADGTALGGGAVPFHGYFFRILPSDGGFALVAWPAQYDATGVMTFLVNQDGEVREKDLGTATAQSAQAMKHYDADVSWRVTTQ
jgi:hypothetical protein